MRRTKLLDLPVRERKTRSFRQQIVTEIQSTVVNFKGNGKQGSRAKGG